MLTEAQRIEHMTKVRNEYLAKEAEKLEKAHAKLEKKINAKLENGTETSKAVKELIDSGVITIKDLYNPVTLDREKFDDVIEFYQENPPEDVPENGPESSNDDTYTYFHSEYEPPISNAPKAQSTVTEEAPTITVENVIPDQDPINGGIMFTEDIYNKLILDPTIQEAYPDISINDLYFNQGLLLVKLPKTDESGNIVEEAFRIDVINEKFYVQAPLDAGVPNPNNSAEIFRYVAVPLDSEIGKNIITGNNYVVKVSDIDINTTIFRLYENAA